MLKTGIFAKVLQWVFMEKSVRASLAERQRSEIPSSAPVAGAESNERNLLKDSALALLRERRGEFEALDKNVQDRVAMAAAKALGGADKSIKSGTKKI